jgi:hypothetical protein
MALLAFAPQALTQMQLLNVELQPNKSHKVISRVLEETRIETGRWQ